MLFIDFQPFELTFTAGVSQVFPLNNADGFNLYAICDVTTTTGELGVETAADKDQAGTWPEDTSLAFTGGADAEFHDSIQVSANFARITIKSGADLIVKVQRWRKGGGN